MWLEWIHKENAVPVPTNLVLVLALVPVLVRVLVRVLVSVLVLFFFWLPYKIITAVKCSLGIKLNSEWN